MHQLMTEDHPPSRDWGWPWSPVALAVMAGTGLGGSWGSVLTWLIAASLLLGTGLFLAAAGRQRWAAWIGWCVLVLIIAGMTASRLRYHPNDTVRRFLGLPSQLAQVRGEIVQSPVQTAAHRGAFAKYSAWEPPRTFFVLALTELQNHGRWEPCHGRLLVRLDQATTELHRGEKVEITGWLSAFDGPLNPGEADRRIVFERRGIDGRLTTGSVGNVRRLGMAGPGSLLLRCWSWGRAAAASAASGSLHLGLRENPTRSALLDALLLGKRSWDLTLVAEAFRQTGLVHLLSISGAHLGILMLLVGLVAWRLVESPVKLTWMVLGVLGIYLLVLPMQVPIVRTAIMVVCLCLGWCSGRKVTGLAMVSLACVFVLLWKPGELWNPGFQLSYGLTAGLIAFTGPVSRMLMTPPQQTHELWTPRQRLQRWGVGLLAANLVGFALAIPLVAFHFGLISWIALPWSLLALPLVTAVIGLGFLKLVLGLIWPSVGYGLASWVEWPAQRLLDLVQWGASLSGASWELAQPVSWLWTLMAMLLLVTIGLGWWQGRGRLALLCMAGLLGWLVVVQEGNGLSQKIGGRTRQTQVQLHMLAVGEGSCILLRIPDQTQADGEHTLMFDCGSRAYLDVGLTTVAPALRALGVREINTLMISHVDLDHLSGTIDLAGRMPIHRLLVSPQYQRAVEDRPQGPAGFLWGDFQERRIPIQIVAQGWQQQVGPVELELLWPPADKTFARTNDTSLVLSIQVGVRRVLLTGDIAEEAIRGLVSSGMNLRAEVTDLPHHGSFHRASMAWLDAVQPVTVLQSCGRTRLIDDPWPQPLAERSIHRWITQRDGMISLTLVPAPGTGHSQAVQWRTFRRE